MVMELLRDCLVNQSFIFDPDDKAYIKSIIIQDCIIQDSPAPAELGADPPCPQLVLGYPQCPLTTWGAPRLL